MFKPGTVVKLKYSNGLNEKQGVFGIIVDGKKEFPIFYKELQERLTKTNYPQSINEFTGITWVNSKLIDGMYLNARFEQAKLAEA